MLLVLATTLALPLREFLAQRERIAEVRAQSVAQERRVAELERQKELWKDPAYVAAQARERLHFVRPGESKVIVLSPEEAPAPGTPPPSGQPDAGEQPWYARLWQSVQAADDAGR